MEESLDQNYIVNGDPNAIGEGRRSFSSKNDLDKAAEKKAVDVKKRYLEQVAAFNFKICNKSE